MEHSYLRFKIDSILGLHTTRAKSLCYLKRRELIITAQANNVVAYSKNLKTTSKVFSIPKSFEEQEEIIQVTEIAASPNEDLIAVGYSNSEILVFDIDGEVVNHFVGHRRPISALAFADDSSKLASGGQDNDIIVWDCSGDCGICRFAGHQNVITDLLFIPGSQYLVSSSKDTHIRVWDMEIQSCVQTVTSASSELYSLAFLPPNRIISAGKSSDFFVFTIADPDTINNMNPVVLSLSTQVPRQSSHRVHSIKVSDDCKSFILSSNHNTLDLWKIYNDDEIEKKKKRRQKRAEKSGGVATDVIPFELDHTFDLKSKICCVSFLDSSNIAASLSNNSIVIASSVLGEGEEKPIYKEKHRTLGHVSDIRGISFMSDKILSVSEGELRIWDIESKQCISNILVGNASSVLHLPGDRFVIVGTREGYIEMVDINSCQSYTKLQAHSTRIWSIARNADCSEIATGSGDHEVHFWGITFQKIDCSEPRPVLVHRRTLKLPDEVYSVSYSPEDRFIAAALLDSTVRIFHTDTLNFHLSLYGSQLPVTSIDFSSDGSLIVTGSADKNLRIWGTEFGDCHRSMWAHDSVVVAAKFIPSTHLAWSAGRDGILKLWDCDRFLCVQRLRSHIGEIYALSVSQNGSYVVTGGRDKGLRMWKRTSEHLYVSEEKSIELERRIESENAARLDRTVAALRGSILGGVINDLASRQSVESIEHGDKLSDAIEAADKETLSPGTNPLMRLVSPTEYVLKSIRAINRANMDIVMQSLPFHSAISLIRRSLEWLKEGKEVELTVRFITTIIKYHRTQIEAASDLRATLEEVMTITHMKVTEMRDRCGSNLAALKLISKEMKQ